MKKLLFAALFILSISSAFAAPSDTATLTMQVGDALSKNAAINVKDSVTSAALQATVTDVVVTNNNPELATVIISPISATTVRATPKAAGTGYATVTCTVTYTDPGDGLQKTEQKSIVIAYTVVGTPHGAKLSLTFN